MKKLFCWLFCYCCSSSFAQEPFYSQFFASPLQLNPAYAGTEGCSRASLSLRNQFPASAISYQRAHFGYDQYVPFMKAGVGLNLLHRFEESELQRTTEVGYIHSQHFQIGNYLIFRPALEFIYRHSSLDNKFPSYQPINVFDLNAGILAYMKDLYIGFVVYHIAEPSESYWPVFTNPREMATKAHLGFNVFRSKDEKFAVAPWAIFYNEIDFQALWTGLSFSWKNYSAGAAFSDLDHLIFQGRYSRERFRIGYSYDHSTIKTFPIRYSAHEITLSVLFNCKNKRGKIVHPLLLAI